jgi:hypothetical protein
MVLLLPLSIWFYLNNGKRDWRQLLPALIGVGWFIIVSEILFPASSFSQPDVFPYGGSMVGIVTGAVFNPLQTVGYLINIKLAWIAGIVGALGFVPLFSSVVLAGSLYLGLLVFRWRIYTVLHPLKQYAFPVFPFLLYGIYREADTAAHFVGVVGDRFSGQLGELVGRFATPRKVLYIIAVISVVSMLITSTMLFVFVSESDNRYNHDQPLVISDRDDAAWSLINQIPSDAPVMATYIYHPALAQRADLHKLPPNDKECWLKPGPAYILLDTEVEWLPGPDINDSQINALINDDNTDIIDQNEGIILLKERHTNASYGSLDVGRDVCPKGVVGW